MKLDMDSESVCVCVCVWSVGRGGVFIENCIFF